jgi:hypothetical protein
VDVRTSNHLRESSDLIWSIEVLVVGVLIV